MERHHVAAVFGISGANGVVDPSARLVIIVLVCSCVDNLGVNYSC